MESGNDSRPEGISNEGDESQNFGLKKKKTRGPTVKKNLTENFDNVKLVIEFDKGKIVGRHMRQQVVGWQGHLARTVVPLNMRRWKEQKKKGNQEDDEFKTDLWEQFQCPRQDGIFECGYFVLRVMRHLMEDPNKSLETKVLELGEKRTYTNVELTEIRIEFITMIQEHMLS